MLRDLFALTVLACFSLPLLVSAEEPGEIRLALHWLPQAQFAGYYVALEKGFYEEAGLNLSILPGNPDSIPAARLSSGEAHFATMFLAHALEHYSSGIPLVNIAQMTQRSGLMIVTKKRDNIRSIQDFEGRRIAMWAHEFQLQPWALFKQNGIRVETIPFTGSMELFLKGAVPATLAMWYNEYHAILTAGFREEELQPIFFKDTPFDFPEDGIYCLADTARQHPEMVKAMISASIRGWRYAFSHEDEALEIIRKHMHQANLSFSPTHQRWMLRIMEQIMLPREPGGITGKLDRQSFDTVSTLLYKESSARRLPDYDEFVWSGGHGN